MSAEALIGLEVFFLIVAYAALAKNGKKIVIVDREE